MSRKVRWAALSLLLVMLLVGTLPGYVGGRWPWTSEPPVGRLRDLRAIEKQGLSLAGWTTTQQGKANIGGKRWWQQSLRQGSGKGAAEDATWPTLSLLPMRGPGEQPAVEWTDWLGAQRLQGDSETSLPLTVEVDGKRLAWTARLLRGVNARNQTWAIAQWYAWPGGGSADPGAWFWADRAAQLRGSRLPWVAVVVAWPTDRPLDEVEDYRDRLQTLSVATMQALETKVLRPPTARQ